MKKLQDKVAVVVGGGGAIGGAIAAKLSAEGARLAVIDRGQEAADRVVHGITSLGGEAVAYALDITRYAEVQETMDGIAVRFGRIDILINSAGGSARETTREAVGRTTGSPKPQKTKNGIPGCKSRSSIEQG